MDQIDQAFVMTDAVSIGRQIVIIIINYAREYTGEYLR